MFTKTLSDNAQKALAVLGKSILPKDTYMAGGSALALHFGHRISDDFDFFTQNTFSSSNLEIELKKVGDFKSKKVLSDTLLGTFNNVQFSIFYYNYPLLFPPHDFLGIKLADPKDIAAMKIAVAMDRGSKKDFIDLYFLSRNGISLKECLNLYDQKYHNLKDNLYSIITSLSYFADAEASETPIMLEKTDWNEIKSFFEKEAIRLAQKYL